MKREWQCGVSWFILDLTQGFDWRWRGGGFIHLLNFRRFCTGKAVTEIDEAVTTKPIITEVCTMDVTIHEGYNEMGVGLTQIGPAFFCFNLTRE
jgi:hypothetical protein